MVIYFKWQLSILHLDEGISGAVVCDGEPQGVLGLRHLHLLRLASDVSEDEVFQSDLASQQLLHVHFMRVECAEQDLNTGAEMCKVYTISALHFGLMSECTL